MYLHLFSNHILIVLIEGISSTKSSLWLCLQSVDWHYTVWKCGWAFKLNYDISIKIQEYTKCPSVSSEHCCSKEPCESLCQDRARILTKVSAISLRRHLQTVFSPLFHHNSCLWPHCQSRLSITQHCPSQARSTRRELCGRGHQLSTLGHWHPCETTRVHS